MPLYESKCESCGKYHDYFKSVQEYRDTPMCCDQKTIKVIRTAPVGYVKGRFDAFRSHVDGSIIANARDLKAHNERNGVVSMSEGYSTEELANIKPKEMTYTPNMNSDVGEAIQMLNQGYKPKMEMQDEP